MNTNKFEQYTELTHSFIQGEWPLFPVPPEAKLESFWCVFEDEKAAFITKLFTKVRDERYFDRMRQVDMAFREAKLENNDVFNARIGLLKSHFCHHLEGVNWKDALYGNTSVERLHLSITYQTIEHDGGALCRDGFKKSTFPLAPIYNPKNSCYPEYRFAVLGNTSTTNARYTLDELNQNHDQQGPSLTLIPDALDSGFIIDTDNKCTGVVFALAHTCAPPFVGEQKIHTIARGAKFATKHAARLMSQPINDPENFKNNLLKFVLDIEGEIRCKTNDANVGVTLLAGRSFIINDYHQRVIGMNIGHSILIGWHPHTKTLYPISSARIAANGQKGLPALIPSTRSKTIPELRAFDITVPNDTILIPVSHGIAQYFKQVPSEHSIGSHKFLEYSLDPKQIHSLLAHIDPSARCEDYVKAIANQASDSYRAKLHVLNEAAMASEQDFLRLTERQNTRSNEIFHELDALSQREDVLVQTLAAQNNVMSNELQKESDGMKLIRGAINIELQELQQSIDEANSKRHYTIGDNCGLLAMQLPSSPYKKANQDSPRSPMNLYARDTPVASKIKSIDQTVNQLLDSTYGDLNGRSLTSFFFNSQENTVRRLQRSKGFCTLEDYASYLTSEKEAVRDKKSIIAQAIDKGLEQLQSHVPGRRWILHDQIFEKETNSIKSDPDLNRQIATQLFNFVDGEETSWYNKGVTTWHAWRPFNKNGTHRPLTRFGQTACIHAAGSLGTKILLCTTPQEYHTWVRAAQSIIAPLHQQKSYPSFCTLLEKLVCDIDLLFPSDVEPLLLDNGINDEAEERLIEIAPEELPMHDDSFEAKEKSTTAHL